MAKTFIRKFVISLEVDPNSWNTNVLRDWYNYVEPYGDYLYSIGSGKAYIRFEIIKEDKANNLLKSLDEWKEKFIQSVKNFVEDYNKISEFPIDFPDFNKIEARIERM